MSFLKFANAELVKPGIGNNEWFSIQKKALASNQNLKTSSKILSTYSPDDYLLSHCTIISSVDTEKEPLNDKKWEYVITPETSCFVNNNQDAWERNLLLASYKTFINGENYVEHIQIPKLSKGKIVDAVARDIGDSVYIDILVATSKKHAELVSKIKSGSLNTLSMGCQVEFTICTKCGGVAEDEVQLCPCVKYEKGNKYVDKLGTTRIIAELCGHVSVPDSCKFIEASWVKNPAFAGAVLRNILTPEQAGVVSDQLKVALDTAIKQISTDGMQKAASKKLLTSLTTISSLLKQAAPEDEEDKGPPDDEEKAEQEATGEDESADESGAEDAGAEDTGAADEKSAPEETPAEPEAPPPAPVQKVEQELAQKILDNISIKLQKQIGILDEEEPRPTEFMDRNDMLVKSSMPFPEYSRFAKEYPKEYAEHIYTGLKLMLKDASINRSENGKTIQLNVRKAAARLMQAGYTGEDALNILSFIDNNCQIKTTNALTADDYATISKVGGVHKFNDPKTYILACQLKLGRKTDFSESIGLIEKGKIYSYLQ